VEKDVKTYQQNRVSELIFIFFLVLFYLLLPKNVFAQDSKLEEKITIVSRNKELSSILREIEAKSGILFSYSNQQINSNQKITIVARKKKVKDILSQLFNKASIDYIQLEKQLILKPKVPPKEVAEIKVEKPEKFTINGYLKDEETGEMLIGATIAIKGTSTGTITNNYGFYSLSLPKGNYPLQFSYIGYESKLEEIQLNKNQKLSQTLKLDETDLEVIVISASENDDLHTVNPLKKLNLRPLEQNLKKGFQEKQIFFNPFSPFRALIQQVMAPCFFSHGEAIKIKI
jgi:hypothetical protein